MQTTNDLEKMASELATAAHLLKRFGEDVQNVYHHMEILEIVFGNLKRSWTAISLLHTVTKLHQQDKK